MNKDKFLKVRDWKEKNQAQFIPQYCPVTFLKEAIRIKDGQLFRPYDTIGVLNILEPVMIVRFRDDHIHIHIINLLGQELPDVPINDILYLIKRPTNEELINYPIFSK